MSALLSVRDLSVAFPAEGGVVEAVRHIGFDLDQGRTLALVGESGSGKSATATAIMGLLPAGARAGGEVLLGGENLLGLDDRRMSAVRGRRIGMVFQDPLSALTPIFPVGKQVANAVRVHSKVSKSVAWERAIELLDLVGIPRARQRARDFPHQFSGGMRQRVVIAIAIANDPDVIIADEPTTALDVTVQAQILEVLETAKERTGAGVLLITHDLGVVAGHADDVAVMQAGRIVERAGVDDLFRAPATSYTVGLLAALTSGEPTAAAVPGEPVLQVSGLAKSYPITSGTVLRRRVGTLRAVSDVSFEIRAGETFCLVGESGSGKTTTLMEIMRLRAPEAGSIRILGDEVGDSGSVSARHRQAVQIVMQDPQGALDPRLPVFEVLAEPLRAAGWDAVTTRDRVTELLELVGLRTDVLDRFPAAFSGGQRQRLTIARALATRPRLLVLDEPVSALDVSVRAGILNLLAGLRARLGLAYLVVAHDLAVVRHIADRIAVMYLGHIVETGDAETLFARPRHPYTRALLSAVPIPDPERERTRERIVLRGEQPSATDLPPGCVFADRCPLRPALGARLQELCGAQRPNLVNGVACHAA